MRNASWRRSARALGLFFFVDFGEGQGRPHLAAVVDDGCSEGVEKEDAGAGGVDVKEVASSGYQVAGAGPLFQVALPCIFDSLAGIDGHAEVEEGGGCGEGLVVVEDGGG